MSRLCCLLLAIIVPCAARSAHATDEKPKPAPLDLRGSVVPAKRASVTSSIPGQIAEVNVEEGQAVKKGQVLFRLERTTAEGRVRRTAAEVDLALARLKLVEARESEEVTARVEVASAEVQVQLTEAALKRVTDAAQRGGIALAEVHKAELAHRSARATRDKAKATFESLHQELVAQRRVAAAEVEVARAKMDQARRAVEAAEVRAPLDGIVTGLNVEVGAHTNPAMFGLANSATLCEIAVTSGMMVVAEVQESDLQRVSVGQKCEILLDAVPKARLTGTVERLSPVVSRGRVVVRVKIAAGETALRMGMSATVRFVNSASP